MNQKPGKANFRELVSKKIPGGACPRAPLEACSLGPLFRKSVSIYPRSAPVIMRVNDHVVKLVSFPVNAMFDFSNYLKYGICWTFDHVWVQQEKGFKQLAEQSGLRT